MFENHQASFLFINALRSAQRTDSFFQSRISTSDILRELAESVRTILCATSMKDMHEEDMKEKQAKQLFINRNLHAITFFNFLKSNKINCTEAEKYYETIDLNIVNLHPWHFVWLCENCSWGEFFIESARQLPPDILAYVCIKILRTEMDDQRMYYSWHLVLQSIIWKFFMMDDPYFNYSREYEVHSFDFPYSVQNPTDELHDVLPPGDNKNTDLIGSPLYHAYKELLNTLVSSKLPQKQKPYNFDFMKIIFHGFKLIFKLLRKIKTCETGWVKALFSLNPLLKECIGESPEEFLEPFLSVYPKDSSIRNIYYRNMGWNISHFCLAYLLCVYWREVSSRAQESSKPLAELLPFLPSDDDRKTLIKFNPLMKQRYNDADSVLVNFLKTSIHLAYPCQNRAVHLLLAHTEVLASNEIMKVFEENSSILCSLNCYKALAKAVASTETEEVKLRYLKLLYKVMSQAQFNEYNGVMQHILSRWGLCTHFQLPDFDDQLVQFTRKTLSFAEAEKCLPPLFLQSPKVVLQTVIEQALLRGSEGMTLIKVLKHVPAVCKFNNHSLILSMLKVYFSKTELEVHESKNMTLLIQTIMEVQAEEDILPFDSFLTCIMPNFSYKDNNSKLHLVLNCLKTAVITLSDRCALKITNHNLFVLLKHIGLLIDLCMKSGNGRIKELLITILSLLNENPEIRELDGEYVLLLLSAFESLNPAVRIYTSNFLGIDTWKDVTNVSSDQHELLWIWYCFTADSKPLKESISPEKLSYQTLLNTLVSILSHFTVEEWIRCTDFMITKQLHSVLMPPTAGWMLWLNESDSDLYVITRCLVDCFYFLLQQQISDIHYVSSCFTSAVMNLIKYQDVQPELLMLIFTDVCHLSLSTKAEILTVFSSLLLSIKKSICTICTDEKCKENYLKLLLHSVKCLPDSDEKGILLRML